MEKTVEIYYQSLYEAAAVLHSARAAGDILQSMVEKVAKAVGARGSSLMLLPLVLPGPQTPFYIGCLKGKGTGRKWLRLFSSKYNPSFSQ
jgi:uncharacterized UPF0146 family protein